MIPQQSGKIKFCVMKFANIFLMGKLNPQNFFLFLLSCLHCQSTEKHE